MATLINFYRQSICSDEELEAIAALQNLCIAFDHLDGGTSTVKLQENFKAPDFDREKDLQLWRDHNGELRAVATLWCRVSTGKIEGCLHFWVHPDVRNQGLETDIMNWSEQRLRQVGVRSSQPDILQVECRDTLSDRITLYERFGYAPERYFWRMRRSLTEPIPEPLLPEGFEIRQFDINTEAEAWVELFNQSFIDHWNHHPMTLQQLQYDTGQSSYDPSKDLVAVAPDGTLAAFCYSHIDADENARTGRQEGWINLLGTRRGFRRQGLGHAMLLAGLRRLAAEGMDAALLGVDTDNPNQASKLYQSVGFEAFIRFIMFRKTVS